MMSREQTPKLRFLEFSKPWEETAFSDVITHYGGTALEKMVSESGSHHFISIGNYSTTGKYIDNGQRINLVGKAKEKQLNKFDLVMVLNDKTLAGSLIGATILIEQDNKYVYNQRSERIICGEELLPIFAWFLLNSPQFRKKVYSISQGGTQIYVNFPAVKKLKLHLPTNGEQRKIAEFLGAVDAKLDALRRKRELLAEYKRGVMQKLFTQEIRFRQDDGRPFPVWETRKLGELFKFKVGGDVGKLNFSKIKTDIYRYPVFANGDGEGIHGYADDFQYQPPAVTVTGRGNLGNARFRQEKFNAIVRLIVIEINEQFDGKFIEEAINNLNIFVESTGVPQLTAPQLSGYKLSFPIKKEQQKIASFLTAFDNKITAVDQQIEQIETFKKGLLQQMFV